MSDMVTVTQDWARDPYSMDPSARMCRFEFQGQSFLARSIHSDCPAAWPMVIRRADTRESYVTTVGSWLKMPAELSRCI